MNFKKEFYILKELIESFDVKVSFYKNKYNFKNHDADGYADFWDRKIVLAGKPSYKFAIIRLLHEYGHIVDFDRWAKSKRWQLNIQYLYDNKLAIRKVERSIKWAILYSEFLADEQAKRLLKKFKSNYPKEMINEHQFINVHIRNFELTYGKGIYPAVMDIFLGNMHYGMTKENFMDLHF